MPCLSFTLFLQTKTTRILLFGTMTTTSSKVLGSPVPQIHDLNEQRSLLLLSSVPVYGTKQLLVEMALPCKSLHRGGGSTVRAAIHS